MPDAPRQTWVYRDTVADEVAVWASNDPPEVNPPPHLRDPQDQPPWYRNNTNLVEYVPQTVVYDRAKNVCAIYELQVEKRGQLPGYSEIREGPEVPDAPADVIRYMADQALLDQYYALQKQADDENRLFLVEMGATPAPKLRDDPRPFIDVTADKTQATVGEQVTVTLQILKKDGTPNNTYVNPATPVIYRDDEGKRRTMLFNVVDGQGTLQRTASKAERFEVTYNEPEHRVKTALGVEFAEVA